MASTLDPDLEAGSARMADCGRHVGRARAARDHGRVAIDHRVPDLAMSVIGVVTWAEQRSLEPWDRHGHRPVLC